MNALRLGNDILMFFAEMAMLALLGVGGFRLVAEPVALQWGMGLGLPALAIALWSWKLAPRSSARLSQPALAGAKIVLFIIGAIVGTYWNPGFAAIFLLVAIVTVMGEYTLGSNSDTYGRM